MPNADFDNAANSAALPIQLKLTKTAFHCSTMGLPATAASSGASCVKCQTCGGANWCQSSKGPGWDLCPVLNGQAPAPDPVQYVTDAKGVSTQIHLYMLMHMHDLVLDEPKGKSALYS